MVGKLTLSWFGDVLRSAQERLARLRGRGTGHLPLGAPVHRDRDMHLIASYYLRLVGRTATGDVPGRDQVDELLDDRTWSDLEMDAVFAQMDRCASAPGQQVLYAMLRRTDASESEVLRRAAITTALADDPVLRTAIQRELAYLDVRDAYFLHYLFHPDIPERPRLFWVFPLLTGTALAMFGLLFWYPTAALAGMLAIALTNLVIQYRFHTRIAAFIAPLTLLNRMVKAAERIAGKEPTEDSGRPTRTPSLDATMTEVRAAVRQVRPLARVAGYLSFERRSDDLVGSLYAWFNMLLLLDINAFVFSVSRLRQQRDAMRAIFDGIGALDAGASLASWRAQLPIWCEPERLSHARSFQVSGLFHPLVESPVPNSFEIDDECVLITGSNMSGKTTFIRAIALNAVLARTVGTCTAERFRGPALVVRSMIGRADDLMAGKSYFAVELELALRLVESASSPRHHLFVIDEIFRGTNTTERIAASKSVLQRLAAGHHLVIAATHDLELLTLLESGWAFHHFRESVDDDRLTFDYIVRPGPTSTYNAIRMMEVFGFPADVVADARDTVHRLQQD